MRLTLFRDRNRIYSRLELELLENRILPEIHGVDHGNQGHHASSAEKSECLIPYRADGYSP